jgi:delta14-sterol reductase
MASKRKVSQPAALVADEFHGYEFLGPYVYISTVYCCCLPRLTALSPGAFIISFFLPLVCYALTLFCNDISGCPTPSLLHPSTFDLNQFKKEIGWTGFSGLINTKAALGTFGYYFLSLALHAFLPAENVDGTELKTGGKLKYRFNGMSNVQCHVSPLSLRLTISSLLFSNFHPGRPCRRNSS